MSRCSKERCPTTATSASIIAAMQVQEAIKLLHRDRIPDDFGGHGFAFNGLTHDSYVVSYRFREDCLSHDTLRSRVGQRRADKDHVRPATR